MGLTRFSAEVSWGRIRVMGAWIDTVDRVLAPAPANGAALNVSTGAQCSSTSPHRVELLGAPQGEKEQMPLGRSSVLFFLLSPALTLSRPSPRHVYGRRPVSPCE